MMIDVLNPGEFGVGLTRCENVKVGDLSFSYVLNVKFEVKDPVIPIKSLKFSLKIDIDANLASFSLEPTQTSPRVLILPEVLSFV